MDKNKRKDKKKRKEDRVNHNTNDNNQIVSSQEAVEKCEERAEKTTDIYRPSIMSSSDDTELARQVELSKHAYDKWSSLTPTQRGVKLYQIGKLIEQNSNELAKIETSSTGRPIQLARQYDIPQAASIFYTYAGWTDKLSYLTHGNALQPLGIIAHLLPDVSPFLHFAYKVAPSLAAGNTTLVRPSRRTSTTILHFTELLHESLLPNGEITVLCEESLETDLALARHPDLGALTFTGNQRVAMQLNRVALESRKRFIFDQAGKTTNIVVEDADLHQTVNGVVEILLVQTGSPYSTGVRLIIHEALHEHFLRLLKERVNQLRLGDPQDPHTEIGPISCDDLLLMENLISDGEAKGMQCYTSTLVHTDGKLPKEGVYLAPRILTDVYSNSDVLKQDLIGPIITVETFRTLDEAIALANGPQNTEAAILWSSNPDTLQIASKNVDATVVWINGSLLPTPDAPHGGLHMGNWHRMGGWHGFLHYQLLQ